MSLVNTDCKGKKLPSKSRIDYIDLFRAFGIIMMIMGHIYFGGIFDKVIHAFHMPMFFIISGYFYKDQKIGLLIKKRIFTLIVPYTVFGLFHIIVYSLMQHEFKMDYIYRLLWDNTSIGVPISGAVWFLTAMFFSDLIYALIQHGFISIVAKNIVIVSVSLTGMLLATFLPFRFPWALDAALVSVGLIHCGKLIREKYTKLIEMKLWVSLLILVSSLVLVIINGYINMREGKYGIWPLFWINSIGMTISLWNISRFICAFLDRYKSLIMIKKWLEGIGNNSIVYLCFNQIAILLISNLVFLLFPKEDMNSIVLLSVKIGILFVTFIELFVIEKLICQTQLRILIGKK